MLSNSDEQGPSHVLCQNRPRRGCQLGCNWHSHPRFRRQRKLKCWATVRATNLRITSPATMPCTPPFLFRRPLNLPARITSMINRDSTPSKETSHTTQNVGVSGRFKQVQMFLCHARRTACCTFLCGPKNEGSVGWNLWIALRGLA